MKSQAMMRTTPNMCSHSWPLIGYSPLWMGPAARSGLLSRHYLDYFPEIVELWVDKDRRAELAPYLFGHIMSQIWDGGAVLTSHTKPVQLVSYNKVRIGLSHFGTKQFLEALPKLLALGLNGKLEMTGEWINEMHATKSEANRIGLLWRLVI